MKGRKNYGSHDFSFQTQSIKYHFKIEVNKKQQAGRKEIL